jgi:hypothetical protein
MRSLAFLALVVVFMWLLGRAYDAEIATGQPPSSHAKIGDGTLIRAIRTERVNTWRCQQQLNRRRSPVSYAAERSRSLAFRKWAWRLWSNRADHHCGIAGAVGTMSHWLCIHRYEGAWNANTGNGFYGGLQMDYGFQRTYGAGLLRAKGTANNWTPLEQIIVAERARRSGRGYHPWPNAARLCGLL